MGAWTSCSVSLRVLHDPWTVDRSSDWVSDGGRAAPRGEQHACVIRDRMAASGWPWRCRWAGAVQRAGAARSLARAPFRKPQRGRSSAAGRSSRIEAPEVPGQPPRAAVGPDERDEVDPPRVGGQRPASGSRPALTSADAARYRARDLSSIDRFDRRAEPAARLQRTSTNTSVGPGSGSIAMMSSSSRPTRMLRATIGQPSATRWRATASSASSPVRRRRVGVPGIGRQHRARPFAAAPRGSRR